VEKSDISGFVAIEAILSSPLHVRTILPVAIPAAIIAARITAEGAKVVVIFTIESKRYPA
jgi:hypothetical protein